jgi:hypothetical protein
MGKDSDQTQIAPAVSAGAKENELFPVEPGIKGIRLFFFVDDVAAK